MSSNQSIKSERTGADIKSLDEIIAWANEKMDADPLLQGENAKYRQSFLVGVLKSSYQYLYSEYARIQNKKR